MKKMAALAMIIIAVPFILVGCSSSKEETADKPADFTENAGEPGLMENIGHPKSRDGKGPDAPDRDSESKPQEPAPKE